MPDVKFIMTAFGVGVRAQLVYFNAAFAPFGSVVLASTSFIPTSDKLSPIVGSLLSVNVLFMSVVFSVLSSS